MAFSSSIFLQNAPFYMIDWFLDASLKNVHEKLGNPAELQITNLRRA